MPKTRSADGQAATDDASFKAAAADAANAMVEDAFDDGALVSTTTTVITVPGNSANSHANKEVTKIVPAIPLPEPEPDPNVPSDRDVIVGHESHLGTMLLYDLIRMHFFLWKKLQENSKNSGQDLPKSEQDVQDLAARLTLLMMNGKKYELSGLKDVPKPYLKGQGRFFEPGHQSWTRLNDEAAQKYVAQTILAQFQKIADETQDAVVKECVDIFFDNLNKKSDEEPHSAPRPCDVLFLPTEYPWEENMAYENQTGNKHLLMIAAQSVMGETAEAIQRSEAALRLISSKVEVSNGTEIVQKDPRFVIQLSQQDAQNTWDEMEMQDLAEFAVAFVFEVYLEKQIHRLGSNASVSVQMASLSAESTKPSDTPIEAPTTHDVLFGRGGMTNGHPGNRRFRDIIALHRPDYIKASKMDKPNVARRIVRAIRQGNPPGRFLKKCEDGMWRDVGDKVAAEKTSQGLRERTNAEKRHRLALREAMRIRKEDMAEGENGEPTAKRAKTGGKDTLPLPIGENIDYSTVIPLSLSMKDKTKEAKTKRGKKGAKEEESATESLPPNAVDEEGNILVTDYDILCGRGGLTNHHKGNKRFRDIVALHRPDYVRAPKVQKPSVARVIVRAIRNGDPPGRFLKKDEKSGKWIDIGDKKAAEKTSQALREKGNDETSGGKPAVPAGFTSPTLILPLATTDAEPQLKEADSQEPEPDQVNV